MSKRTAPVPTSRRARKPAPILATVRRLPTPLVQSYAAYDVLRMLVSKGLDVAAVAVHALDPAEQLAAVMRCAPRLPALMVAEANAHAAVLALRFPPPVAASNVVSLAAYRASRAS